jgi:hypothetical protein
MDRPARVQLAPARAELRPVAADDPGHIGQGLGRQQQRGTVENQRSPRADEGDCGNRLTYQASLDIAERLAAADPANTQWQRDLSVSRNNLGDAAVAAGDLAAARTHYQASLDIAERLAAADPANTQWQRDLQLVREQIDNLSHAAP